MATFQSGQTLYPPPSSPYSRLLFAVSVKFYAHGTHTHTNRNVNPNQNPNPNPKLLLIWRKINRQIARAVVEEEEAKLGQRAMWAINVSRQDALEGGGGKEGQQRRQEQEEATVASQIKFAFQIRRSSSARFVDSN